MHSVLCLGNQESLFLSRSFGIVTANLPGKFKNDINPKTSTPFHHEAHEGKVKKNNPRILAKALMPQKTSVFVFGGLLLRDVENVLGEFTEMSVFFLMPVGEQYTIIQVLYGIVKK